MVEGVRDVSVLGRRAVEYYDGYAPEVVPDSGAVAGLVDGWIPVLSGEGAKHAPWLKWKWRNVDFTRAAIEEAVRGQWETKTLAKESLVAPSGVPAMDVLDGWAMAYPSQVTVIPLQGGYAAALATSYGADLVYEKGGKRRALNTSAMDFEKGAIPLLRSLEPDKVWGEVRSKRVKMRIRKV